MLDKIVRLSFRGMQMECVNVSRIVDVGDRKLSPMSIIFHKFR